MRRLLWSIMGVALGVGIVALGACVWSGEWTSAFLTEPDELASTGRNPYFILEPGHTLVLEGGGAQLIITVLNETKKDGVDKTRVEERGNKSGHLIVELSKYYAMS